MSTESATVLKVPQRRTKDVEEAGRQPNLIDGKFRLLVIGPAVFRPGYGDEGKHKLELSFLAAPLMDPRDAQSVYRSLSLFIKLISRLPRRKLLGCKGSWQGNKILKTEKINFKQNEKAKKEER